MYFTILVVTGIILAGILWDRKRKTKLRKYFPGPSSLPFVGNAIELRFLFGDKPEVWFKLLLNLCGDAANDHGGTFSLFLGITGFIYSEDVKIIEAILKTGNLVKPAFRLVNNVFEGVVASNGEKWKEQRRILNPFFQVNNLYNFVQVFNDQSIKLCENLKKQVGQGVFNVKKDVGKCGSDIAAINIFSINNVEGLIGDIDLLKLTTRIAEIMIFRLKSPWLYFDYIYYKTNVGKEEMRIAKQLFKYVKAGLDRRASERDSLGHGNYKESEMAPHCYVDRVMEHAEKTSMSPVEVYKVILDTLAANYDTTTVTVSYTLLMFGIHQNIQEKVYQEVKSIFGDSNRPATIEDLENMTYLEMVFLETARLVSNPFEFRQIDKAVKVGNRTIPEGYSVYYCPYRVHRNPKYWLNPDGFNPDHHLPENVCKRPKFSFIPFSYGTRGCPGAKYASYSFKTIISTVLRKFKIFSHKTMNEVVAEEYPAFFLELTGGYPIVIEERS